MLAIKQFRYSADNLAYVVYGKSTALAIDGGAMKDVLHFLEKNRLQLAVVTNTHGHPDHMAGTNELVKPTNATYLSSMESAGKKEIRIDGEPIRIYHTPGHTKDSVTFHVADTLIPGDTLFNGTVGNCRSEAPDDMAAFLTSLKFLLSFPEDTIVYAGHDYVEYAMIVARIIEPNNPHIDAYLKKYDASHVRSRLADELRVNPYVRFNDPALIEILKEKNLPVATEYERWSSVMTLG